MTAFRHPASHAAPGAAPFPGFDDRLLELLPVAAYVCDATGMIVRHNRKAAELWGRTPRLMDPSERFCGAWLRFRPDGRTLQADETPMAEAILKGASARMLEVQIEQPNGQRRWAVVNIDPIRSETGEIVGAINCFQDITDKKLAEERASATQRLFEVIVETTPECVKIVARDGTLLQMNPAGLCMVEAEAETAINADILALIAPEHREAWRANHARVCAGENLAWEFDIVGRRGTRRQMETHAAPLPLPDGTVAQLAITRDITVRRRQEAELRDSERRLRELLEALPTAVYTTDASGRITFYNQAAAELWGCRPEIGRSEWCGSWRLYLPDGTPLPLDQCPMAQALKEGRPIRNVEAVLERPDGTRVPFMPYPTPLHDASGRLVGAVNMLVDLTHLKQAEDRQRMLVNELDHRAKNVLAVAQAMLRLTRANSVEEYVAAVQGRIAALARIHTQMAENRWEGVDLGSLVRSEMEPFRSEVSGLAIGGPEIFLTPAAAQSVGIVLHELATNAAKHGALSVPGGTARVVWSDDGNDGGFTLHWSEANGPAVQEPSRLSFGSRVIARQIPDQLGGSAQIEWLPAGLRCTFRIPRSHVVAHWTPAGPAARGNPARSRAFAEAPASATAPPRGRS